MKKIRGLLITLILLCAILIPVYGSVNAAAPDYQHEPLWGGQSTQVGRVNIWHDAEWLYVQYNLWGGWVMTESHLAIALTLDGIPQTKTGNPIPGQFPYSRTYNPPVTNDTYQVPFTTELANAISEGEAGGIYIATHAVVQLMDGERVVRQETAWSDCHTFPGKNWAKCTHYIGHN